MTLIDEGTRGPRVPLPRESLSDVRSPTIVELIYSVVKDQLPAEERRESLLIAKANALLSASGLSLTIAFTFGGLLLQRQEHSFLLMTLYFIALATGLAAAFCALRAMWVEESMAVSAEGLFTEFLKAADDADIGDAEDGSHKVVPTGSGTAAVRKYLVDHFWQIYRFNSDRHSRMSRWVEWGQRLFLAFLFFVLFTGLYVAFNLKGSLPTAS